MFLCRRLALVGRSFQNSVRGFSSISKNDPYTSRSDCRPKAIQARVDFLIGLQDLDTAAKHARLVAFSKTGVRNDDDNLDQSFKYIDQTCDAIIEAMCEAKRYKDALELFHYFYRDSKIKPHKGYFNHIIKSYIDQGLLEDALNLYESSMADTITEYHILKGFVDAGRVDEAMDRLEGNLHYSYTVERKPLFEGLLRQGDIETANEVLGQVWGKCHVYHKLYKYDEVAVLSCKFIEYWFEQGKEEEAMKCYGHLELSKLTEATTVNELFDLFLRYGKTSVAWSLFNEVLMNSEEKHNVDSGTVIIMVNLCFEMCRFDWAIQVFRNVKATKLEKPQVRCYRHIITKLAKQGILFEAEHLFEEMCSDTSVKPDVSTYTTMIDAYVKAGRSEDALRLSNKMVDVFLGQVALLACTLHYLLKRVLNGFICFLRHPC